MLWIAVTALVAMLLGGCSEQKPIRQHTPAPPDIAQEEPEEAAPAISPHQRPASRSPRKSSHPAGAPENGEGASGSSMPDGDLTEDFANVKPIYVETGMASWYGEPYHNRRGANGEVFDMNANTAAHRTLPLNSVARVTNVKSGQSVLVRITDRGPFVGDRILDLSKSAALAIDLWRAGVAKIRLEVLQTPSPIASGGKWAVQIGAFKDPEDATILKSELLEKYPDARVLQFSGPTGDWIRIRVQGDQRTVAEEIAGETQLAGEGTYLVRLD